MDDKGFCGFIVVFFIINTIVDTGIFCFFNASEHFIFNGKHYSIFIGGWNTAG